MIYQKEFKVRANELQRNEVASNRALLSYMEAAASEHSHLTNLGIYQIKTQNKSWVILDWRVQIYERPKFTDIIVVKTWAEFPKRVYSYRYFEMFDSNGKLIAKASSKWVLIDTLRGKITKIDEDFIAKNEDISAKTHETLQINKLEEPTEFEYIKDYHVRRSEIDINRTHE